MKFLSVFFLTSFISASVLACDTSKVYEQIEREVGVSSLSIGTPFIVMAKDWETQTLNWIYKTVEPNGDEFVNSIVVSGKCVSGKSDFEIVTFGKTKKPIAGMPVVH